MAGGQGQGSGGNGAQLTSAVIRGKIIKVYYQYGTANNVGNWLGGNFYNGTFKGRWKGGNYYNSNWQGKNCLIPGCSDLPPNQAVLNTNQNTNIFWTEEFIKEDEK